MAVETTAGHAQNKFSLYFIAGTKRKQSKFVTAITCNRAQTAQLAFQSARYFDQQPVEAQAMVSACLEAFRCTRDDSWWREARRAFEWFLGRNDLGIPLHDPSSGGCRDGLHHDRANENQGAESTLAFQLALAEMNAAEHSLTQPLDTLP